MLLSVISIMLLSVFNVQCITILRGKVFPKQLASYVDNLGGTELHIRIEDVALRDAPSTVLSERVIKLAGGRKFPIYFEIVYPKAVIATEAPEYFFIISASIKDTVNNELLYATDEAYFLPRGDNVENLVTLRVVKIGNATVDNTDPCTLLPESGACYAYFQKYFFNSTSGTCEIFVYGGCGGNMNRFDDKDQCLAKCSAKRNENLKQNKNPICSLPKIVGPCKAAIPRYFYNITKNSCEEFIYGGCRGNENNFKNLTQCIDSCYDVKM